MVKNLKIRQLRISKNLKQGELAELIGVTDSAISAIELGKISPNGSLLIKLANFFEVSTDELLDNSSKTNESNNSMSEKLYSELKLQFEFLQRNFERVIEENGRLSRTLENLTSTGNFQEGNNLSASLISEVVALAAA